jgi:hypothetical protein
VVIRGAGVEAEAWTLNVSRGGLRVVLEEPVTLGGEYQVIIGEGAARPVRVVWLREEADGQIAGMQFLDVEGEASPSAPPPSLSSTP